MVAATGKALERKRKRGLCIVCGCSRKAYRYKKRKPDLYCHRHRHEQRKAKDPVAWHYYRFKSNSKRRKKAFTLTLSEFREFCDKTNYITLKGRRSGGMSIDRIRDNEGYNKDNIRLLECGDNSRKQYVDYYIRQEGPQDYSFEDAIESPVRAAFEDCDLPF